MIPVFLPLSVLFFSKYIFNLALLFIVVVFVEVNSPLLIITTRKVPSLLPLVLPFAREESEGKLKGILGFTKDDVVSTDFIGDSR
ncbi:hypothetical protein LOK49_LG04G01775 [Camellia lanceoleosa]|uniref:Uncharacterized protein n=1 Tax=Camellia lanceoleosa TaxID=1840588 RepID=A0ACC0HZP4_9ERIC|nr:hypothetical protein LOK49_LG04G01775 [Camellia lanceoleosa]